MNMMNMKFSGKYLLVVLIVALSSVTGISRSARKVFVIKSKSNKTVFVQGDLNKGAELSSLRWASRGSVACFPATQNTSYRGNHVFYGTQLPPRSIMTITLKPERGKDINLYAYSTGTSSFTKNLPPKLSRCVSCEASNFYGRPSPGKKRTVTLNATRNPYNVIIGVAGPKGVTSGKYKLSISLKTGKAEPVFKGTLPIKMITSVPNKTIEIKGEISGGKVVPLRWASYSSVACFPATQNTSFRGNHVIYGTSLPSYSIMNIYLMPEPGKDLNLYAYTIGTRGFARVPPKVSSCVSCEASYFFSRPSPGKTRKVYLNAIRNPYNVVIGIAGPKGVTSGSFTLRIELKTTGQR